MIRKTLKAVLMASALSAAVFASAPAFAAGKLTVSSPQDPGSWDPIDTFLVNWASVATNIFDGLVYRGPDLKIVPALAASWDELDDGKRIRFHLRENVKFHNGEPFNAEGRASRYRGRYRHDRTFHPRNDRLHEGPRIEIVAAACIVDRSAGKADVGTRLIALAEYEVPAYPADKLPPELAAIPAVKPGSRNI